MITSALRVLLVLVLSAGLAAPAVAEPAFPAKPIRLIVPFVAGGTSDILARIMSEALQKELGESVIVDNKPGAGGNIGADFVAKSPPDGYTLILASVGTHAINPSLYRAMPYDPVKDFTPISLIATVPTVLVVGPSVKADSVRELIALAKAHPGQLNYGSAGIGTTQQLAGEMLKQRTGVDVVHVPYKGGAQAVGDLLGGRVAFMFPNIPVVYGQIKAGKLRPLAVASPHRSPALPDVPTMAEAAGLKDFDVSTWFGILGAAGMPPATTATLNAAIKKVLARTDVRAQLEKQGAEPLTSTPEEFGTYIGQEIAKWAQVVKQAGIVLE
jgi:tripartite-type tricarboxylate transporter receptor subunit TctC